MQPFGTATETTIVFICSVLAATVDAQGDLIAAGTVVLTPLGTNSLPLATGGGTASYTTYAVEIQFDSSRVANIYTIYGDDRAPLEFPPVYQVAAPFGSNVGPTKSAFWQFKPEAQWDSYLTVGATIPAGSSLSSIGIPFSDWTETTGLSVDDGAVFFMDPSVGPKVSASSESIVVAQVTYVHFCFYDVFDDVLRNLL